MNCLFVWMVGLVSVQGYAGAILLSLLLHPWGIDTATDTHIELRLNGYAAEWIEFQVNLAVSSSLESSETFANQLKHARRLFIFRRSFGGRNNSNGSSQHQALFYAQQHQPRNPLAALSDCRPGTRQTDQTIFPGREKRFIVLAISRFQEVHP